ncbi:choice-of-anchor M domain-containing protein [Actinomyces bouchesdurhonensis]|uniref:choice-of-anchor M domain-containing protein n=1 Tax=Actinomyces bouchesdurhonensis TaxID=1852361 RepID=UPI0028ED1D0D|nr:choice-of-anchor M domain-containing protein [Actinomyces bouchesdurhonensis]
MSYLRRISTAALALFLALTPAAAWAGPDQDKEWIVTGQHVDAPIPVWHDDTNSFSLNTINMPMEKTALWIPKAWTGTGEKDEAKSQLVVPAGRADLSFLGAEGTVLNAAPQNPGPGNTPIWAGLGAGEIGDTDKFEGETYTLDLISVDGPGRMEMFIDNGDSVNRFLSSHDTAYRSVYNPRHTHLYTTFTQPGRYVANYKMTARSADGSAIYSSPITPLVWQVGGANPADGTIKDIEAAYNSARAERADGNAATPTLTLSHHAERAHPGDNHLTDIMIDTGVSTDTGRAWITVNGYFLTEAVVEGGRATVSELLGADAAAVQAIYIPGDSASARWISQPAQYSQKDIEPVTVGGGDTILGPSNPDPAPVWNPDHLPVSSRRVDVSYDLVPGTTDQYTATVRAADPTLRATYKIEFLESKYDFSPWCSMEGTLGAGGVDTKPQDLGVCQSDPMYMRVILRPHPLSDAIMTVADASDVTVGEHVGLTAMLNLRDGAAAPEEPEPAPTSDPSPSPGHGDGEAPAPASSLLSDPVEIARGHLDVRLTQAAGENGTTYGLAAKDDSLTAARTSVLRTLESTTLAVAPNARFVRPASLSDASYDVLGPVGAATYVLPETQNSDIVWPGLSTEGIDYAALPEGADLTLHLAQAPVGARVAFFQGGTFGAGAKVHFDSTKGDGVVHTTESTHMHGNWVFSAPGTYRIEVGARSGERVLAEPQGFTVIVRGGHHEQPAPAPGDEPVPTPSPGPAPTPDPEPTPAPVPTVDPVPAPAPSTDPAPAPSANPVPAPSANPAPAPSANPAPAPSAPQGKALSRIAPTGASGTTGGGALRSAGGTATTSGSGSAPAASSAGTTVSAPKAAPAATPSPSAAAGAGAQSGETPQSAAPEATTYGSNDAAAAALPVATSAESSRSGGWSPYWLLLLVIPAALAGGGAGFLIRTR